MSNEISSSSFKMPSVPDEGPSLENYTIGWICALKEECEAACRMLDREYGRSQVGEDEDCDEYIFGRIQLHNVIIVRMPTKASNGSPAETVAKSMSDFFPGLRFALLVGTGGGCPTEENDIRLGDVVVSEPRGRLNGVVQYDFKRRLEDGRLERIGQLDTAPKVLLKALPEMKRRQNDPRKPDAMARHMARMEEVTGFERPPEDRLYDSENPHRTGTSCMWCGSIGLVKRSQRAANNQVTIHYGTIASAKDVLKNPTERDQYAKDESLNILSFETAAAGLMKNFPCLVIRGISDYCDTHRNAEWQSYAALTSAAYARELLHVVRPTNVDAMPPIFTVLEAPKPKSHGTSKTLIRLQSPSPRNEAQILSWLSPIDHASAQADYSTRRHPGTGQWLLETEAYKRWLSKPKQTLFCPGTPGSGKTFLTSLVVEELTAKYENDSRIGISYVYCNAKQKLHQTSEDVLANLVKQLSSRLRTLPRIVTDLYDRYELEDARPSSIELLRALQVVSKQYSKVFIILDGLEELQVAENDRSRFITTIQNFQSSSNNANILVTSRLIPEITRKFTSAISLEIRSSDLDMQKYLDHRITQSRSEALNECRYEIIRKVRDIRGGTFLVAYLLFKMVKIENTASGVRKTLAQFPSESDAYFHAYSEMINQIDSFDDDTRSLAWNALTWITHAKRPLTKLELQYAVAITPGTPVPGPENLPSMSSILTACSGFITVVKKTNVVRLIHSTAQECFDSMRAQFFADAESIISTICVKYLESTMFDYRLYPQNRDFLDRVEIEPLLRYAACNWGHHARAASSLPSAVADFLLSEDKANTCGLFTFWLNSQPKSSRSAVRAPKDLSGLHLAAYFGIAKAFSSEFGMKAKIDWADSYSRTPLAYAAMNGYEETVVCCVDKDWVTVDAAINKKDKGGYTPLALAAMNGHEGAVKQLLATGIASCNTMCENEKTPLYYAAERGHESIVNLLLSAGQGQVDPNFPCKHKRTPLFIAASCGEEDIVKTLLSAKNIDLESLDYRNRTPLSIAAKHGHEGVVRLLLATKKVDCNTRDYQDKTPFAAAAEQGHSGIMKVLLEEGKVNPNQQMAAGRSILASSVGSIKRLLVSAGYG